jgi:hypothetical protein
LEAPNSALGSAVDAPACYGLRHQATSTRTKERRKILRLSIE